LDEELLKDKNLSIKIVGDITCDIKGSILSTIRPSTHAEPFYDFNPSTMDEEPAFSSENNISVMAVDTCPNALALDTSSYFGQKLSEYVFPLIVKEQFDHPILKRATILSEGKLTDKYSYLKGYAGLL
jgi:alanine dehydrogenase